MASSRATRYFTLVQRELQEYKVSLVFTPIVIAGVLTVLMLGSILFANQITAMGGTFMNVIMSERGGIPVIRINIDDDGGEAELAGPDVGATDLNVEIIDEPGDEEDWNFSREWRFEYDKRDKQDFESTEVGSLNPVLHVIHGLLFVVLIIVTVNYLLGCLFNDRKDRSILFWRSLPVSEWEEVLVRFLVALLVVPAIYLAVSLLTQVVFVLLAMLLAWRMDTDPFEVVLGNLELGPLVVQQVGGWLLTALWVAPVYAWLLLASAWARRSPFLAAVAPVVALVVIEGLILGSDYVANAVKNHVPHYIGGESVVGFYFHRDFWLQIDYVSLATGLVFAAAAVVASVYLRRYRFEI